VLSTLLAHQGGWDEILLVLVPIALFAALLLIANRRAGSIEQARQDGESRDAGTGRSDRRSGER
jgi:hypothetical protein